MQCILYKNMFLYIDLINKIDLIITVYVIYVDKTYKMFIINTVHESCQVNNFKNKPLHQSR